MRKENVGVLLADIGREQRLRFDFSPLESGARALPRMSPYGGMGFGMFHMVLPKFYGIFRT